MSVIKNKRSLSELEFFHNAIKLRKEMTDLLLRDFGVKARKKDPQIFPKRYSMDKDDGEAFMKLCEKYKIVSIIETYPDWLINEFRTSILKKSARTHGKYHRRQFNLSCLYGGMGGAKALSRPRHRQL